MQQLNETYYKKNRKGEFNKTCITCANRKLCVHKIRKDRCKDCGGSQICKHGREKYTCKECGGKGICSHNNQKAICKECQGAQICQHNKRKNSCIICDKIGYLKKTMRTVVISRLGDNATEHYTTYYGCTASEYKFYIDGLLADTEYSWDNRDLWDLDHKIPINYNNPTLEEKIKRLHYSNTAPLWKIENLKKGDKYISS